MCIFTLVSFLTPCICAFAAVDTGAPSGTGRGGGSGGSADGSAGGKGKVAGGKDKGKSACVDEEPSGTKGKGQGSTIKEKVRDRRPSQRITNIQLGKRVETTDGKGLSQDKPVSLD